MANYTRTWVRLLILQSLSAAPGYTRHQVELLKELAKNGAALSRDDLHLELSWLENADAVVLQIVDGVYIATLTWDGQEAAEGVRQIPGIHRPAPKG